MEPCQNVQMSIFSTIQQFKLQKLVICSPGSLLQAPPLSGKLPPVTIKLLQDFELDGVYFVSCAPDLPQLEQFSPLIPDALLQHL